MFRTKFKSLINVGKKYKKLCIDEYGLLNRVHLRELYARKLYPELIIQLYGNSWQCPAIDTRFCEHQKKTIYERNCLLQFITFII